MCHSVYGFGFLSPFSSACRASLLWRHQTTLPSERAREKRKFSAINEKSINCLFLLGAPNSRKPKRWWKMSLEWVGRGRKDDFGWILQFHRNANIQFSPPGDDTEWTWPRNAWRKLFQSHIMQSCVIRADGKKGNEKSKRFTSGDVFRVVGARCQRRWNWTIFHFPPRLMEFFRKLFWICYVYAAERGFHFSRCEKSWSWRGAFCARFRHAACLIINNQLRLINYLLSWSGTKAQTTSTFWVQRAWHCFVRGEDQRSFFTTPKWMEHVSSAKASHLDGAILISFSNKYSGIILG